ncbi:MAG: hypothetical protein MUC95_02530 [Spirochaetes bacterium]|nr:hypothetical protein [Spirochaetota bacterium]
MFQNGQYILAVLFLLLLTIIIAGMAKNIFKMSFGDDAVLDNTHSSGMVTWMPQVIFLIILLIFGIMLPESINSIINSAVINL